MRRIRGLLHRRTSLMLVWLVILVTYGCETRMPASGLAPGNQQEMSQSPSASVGRIPRTRASDAPKKPQHVFLIVLENESYDVTFGPTSKAYLKTLATRGVLLTHYYGVGHQSLDNYIAMISGQAPNEKTQADCPVFIDWNPAGKPVLDSDGQVAGKGCVYPPGVSTIADQFDDATPKLTWKAYMEDMGNASHNDTRQEVDERSRCRHPRISSRDETYFSLSKKEDQYVTRHNPFVYFHSIIDHDEYCEEHDVPLVEASGAGLEKDLSSVKTTPNFALISPNVCHDGHDPTPKERKLFRKTRCWSRREGGQLVKVKGGVHAVNGFLREWVPRIENSPAFKQDGLLIITFDEAEDKGAANPDYSATAGERPGPGPDAPPPGRSGPGGGRVGAVVLSPLVKAGSVNDIGYNHYSMLRSIEDLFGLQHLGYAQPAGLKTFQEGGVFN